jgi:hypothetical protein
MPRFFLHSRDRASLNTDVEGQEFPEIEEARAEALRVGKQAIADHLKGGGKLSAVIARSIEIADETGMLKSVVTFAEAAEADDHRP